MSSQQYVRLCIKAIERNPTIYTQRVLGKLDITKSIEIRHIHKLVKYE